MAGKQNTVLPDDTSVWVAHPPRRRLASVDCLRGLAVAGMILANNPGDDRFVYGALEHAVWHGWTAVDFVFPFFLFLVGVCVALSVDRDAVAAGRVAGFWRKAFRRACVLFLLGLLLNAAFHPDLARLRIPGVLQRIAIVSLASAWLHVRMRTRGLGVLIAVVLVGYWLFVSFVPVPGLGRPGLGPDANWEGWIDQLVLRGHTWSRPTAWDPEGILSTLPAITLGLIGVLAGRWLDRGGMGAWKVAVVGLGLHLLGLAWHTVFPINKSLCTSSFVLFVAGAALMLLAGLHGLMDVRGRIAWAKPLVILGTNPLTVYVGASLAAAALGHIPGQFFPEGAEDADLQEVFYTGLFGGFAETKAASLAWAVLFLCVVYLGARWLYTRRIVIRA